MSSEILDHGEASTETYINFGLVKRIAGHFQVLQALNKAEVHICDALLALSVPCWAALRQRTRACCWLMLNNRAHLMRPLPSAPEYRQRKWKSATSVRSQCRGRWGGAAAVLKRRALWDAGTGPAEASARVWLTDAVW